MIVTEKDMLEIIRSAIRESAQASADDDIETRLPKWRSLHSLTPEIQKKLNYAYFQIDKWQKQFIKMYAPETNNLYEKNISVILSRVDVSYEDFYRYLKRRLTIKLPGFPSGEPGEPINFSWRPDVRDVHGARGTFWLDAQGNTNIALDPKYWFIEANDSQKKSLIFHELEHAVSAFIGRFVVDWNEEYTDWDEFVGNKGQQALRSISHEKGQVQLYRNIFTVGAIPDWARSVKTKVKDDDGLLMVPVNVLGKGISWAARFEEQRAVVKEYLSRHDNNIMTSEMMKKLCSEKKRAARFDWKNADSNKINKFIKTFTEMRLDALLFLNCENSSSTVNKINKLARIFKSSDPSFGLAESQLRMLIREAILREDDIYMHVGDMSRGKDPGHWMYQGDDPVEFMHSMLATLSIVDPTMLSDVLDAGLYSLKGDHRNAALVIALSAAGIGAGALTVKAMRAAKARNTAKLKKASEEIRSHPSPKSKTVADSVDRGLKQADTLIDDIAAGRRVKMPDRPASPGKGHGGGKPIKPGKVRTGTGEVVDAKPGAPRGEGKSQGKTDPRAHLHKQAQGSKGRFLNPGDITPKEAKTWLKTVFPSKPGYINIYRGIKSQSFNVSPKWTDAKQDQLTALWKKSKDWSPADRKQAEALHHQQRSQAQFFTDDLDNAISYAGDNGSVYAARIADEDLVDYIAPRGFSQGGGFGNLVLSADDIAELIKKGDMAGTGPVRFI